MRHRFFGFLGLTLFVGMNACGGGFGLQPPDGVCGNGEVEAGELCDASDLGGATCASLNLGDGDLACDSECAFDTSGCTEQAQCGNDEWEYPEECDGDQLNGVTCATLGFASGELRCTGNCQFDTTLCEGGGECGNGAVEAGEQCDGQDVGGATCESLNLGTGSVGCTAQCTFDVSQCSNQAVCDNGTIEFPEVCDGAELDNRTCGDEGFYNGLLGCASDCLSFDVSGCFGACGDGAINGPEVCEATLLDGATCRSEGYYGGDLGCDTDCLDYDYSQCDGTCGDGTVNGPEVCDGGDFDGDSCAARGFYTGTLACNTTCDVIDDTGCAEFCGDGVVNGTEGCDGLEVGTATCADYGLEGTLRCASDCSAPNPATCFSSDLLITEVSVYLPDYIEITNTGSTDIDLDGWSLEWFSVDGGATDTGVLVLPPYTLAAGDRVVIEDANDNLGDPPDVDVPNKTITMFQNITWTSTPGAVVLADPNGDALDFVRWTDGTFPDPMSTWADTPDAIRVLNRDGYSISRVPDLTDTDTAGDWCITYMTPTAANDVCLQSAAAPGTLLVNEVVNGAGTVDYVEIYNPTNAAIDLDGFVVYAEGQQGTAEVLPAYSLAGGAYVLVTDDAGNGGNYVDAGGIHVDNLDIRTQFGSVSIWEPELWDGVDFVRWGGSNDFPRPPDDWTDNPGPLPQIVGTSTDPVSLGRSTSTDTDTAADWCLMAQSLGAANSACN